jgi:hypothetical protein
VYSVKIAGMVVWVLTAGIGIYLLAAGIARRQAGGARAMADDGLAPAAEGATVVGTAALASGVLGSSAGADGTSAGDTGAGHVGGASADGTGADGTGGTGAGAGAGGAGAGGPAGGGPRTPEGSPLLEFTHPLLAVTGLMFWIFYVMTDDGLFAWIAFGVVVATVLAGLSWVLATRRSARQLAAAQVAEPRAVAAGPRFPAHLVMIHGLAAACTLALVIIAAATATHG